MIHQVMPALLLVSPQPLAGKTTLAAGLAQKMRAEGKSFALTRLAGGDNAAADSGFYAGFSGRDRDAESADVLIVEAPAGDAADALGQHQGARVIVVATPEAPVAEVTQYCQALGAPFAGLVLNRVPERRSGAIAAACKSAGLKLLAIIPEDRTLAAPVLSDIAVALDAETRFVEENSLTPIERPLIASIAADPGQGYFARYASPTAIVRSDKPDLQLAALNAGAGCLIVTGGLPILSYVAERVEADEIPLLRTTLDTLETVGSIEALYGVTPFAGGEAKMRRIGELLRDLDFPALAG